MEFGIYSWRPDGTGDGRLKEGAKELVRDCPPPPHHRQQQHLAPVPWGYHGIFHPLEVHSPQGV